MFDYLGIKNMNNVTLELNTDVYPVHDFSMDIAQRGEERDKMENHGEWPTPSYDGGGEIHLEGDIFGTDSTDYNTKRLALVNALRVNPLLAVNHAKRGTLYLELTGAAERWQVDYGKIVVSAPVGGLSPARSAFLITFTTFDPYFIGVASGQPYYWD